MGVVDDRIPQTIQSRMRRKKLAVIETRLPVLTSARLGVQLISTFQEERFLLPSGKGFSVTDAGRSYSFGRSVALPPRGAAGHMGNQAHRKACESRHRRLWTTSNRFPSAPTTVRPRLFMAGTTGLEPATSAVTAQRKVVTNRKQASRMAPFGAPRYTW
jgi:hypothetical protein